MDDEAAQALQRFLHTPYTTPQDIIVALEVGSWGCVQACSRVRLTLAPCQAAGPQASPTRLAAQNPQPMCPRATT